MKCLRIMSMPTLALLLGLGCMFAGAASGPADATQPATQTTQPALIWLRSLDDAYMLAQRGRQSIVVLVESPGDPSSRRQMAAMQAPAVVQQLQGLLLVRLNAEDNRDSVRSLGVGMVPSLRLLNSSGRVVAAQDGDIDPARLAQWLIDKRPAATPALSDAPTALQMISDLGNPDTAVRELALRRLRQDRSTAAPVVETLFTGSMTARLAALDLLDQWSAPVAGIDPWEKSTLTDQRHQSLRDWARTAASQPGITAPATAPAVELELDAMVSAPSDADARAVRERLVVYGETILPAVVQRLHSPVNESALRRLLALRYRLVASERLAAQWPGGFDRLAAGDAAVRRAAVDELDPLVQREDCRMLVELFTDSDPFLRERSLSLLRKVGGPQTNKALIQLLHDPEPNVRAAVLKTLADGPDVSLTADLVSYVHGETDTDLIVHAIHVLQDTPDHEAVICLGSLLPHPQWRVRAEACEAIYQRCKGNTLSDIEKAALTPALIKCLKDPDGFVASRASQALTQFGTVAAFQAVLDALDAHPELALDVLKSIDNDRDNARALLPRIRKLTASSQPAVRAAAITTVCLSAPKDAGDEVIGGLEDKDASVRRASGLGLLEALQLIFPTNGTLNVDPGGPVRGETVEVDPIEWVSRFKSGPARPAWMKDKDKGQRLDQDLHQLLGDPDAQSRCSAAVMLCALGKQDEVWPVLKRCASEGDDKARETAARALPWLAWTQRSEFFTQVATASLPGRLYDVLQYFNAVPDPRTAGPMWDILANPSASESVDNIFDYLPKSYGLPDFYQRANGTDVAPAVLKRVSDVSTNMLQHGSDLQKTAALCLLATASQRAATQPAADVYNNPANSISLRTDALQVALLVNEPTTAESLAVAALSNGEYRKVAVEYLALGPNSISSVHGIYMRQHLPMQSYITDYNNEGAPITVTVPAGVQTANVQPLLSDADPEVVAEAGYLLALLGDRQGLVPLVKKAREQGWNSQQWTKLVYRAVAKLNDDSQIPLLQEIYAEFKADRPYEMREFYWTIRTMTGPEALKFRKKIRDEVGMDQLR